MLPCAFIIYGCKYSATGTMIDDDTGGRFHVCAAHTDLNLAQEIELRYVPFQ